MAVASVEHSVQISTGVRAIAKRDGVEIRVDLNGSLEEIICCIPWQKIACLQALISNER
jgi:hypothetical protein